MLQVSDYMARQVSAVSTRARQSSEREQRRWVPEKHCGRGPLHPRRGGGSPPRRHEASQTRSGRARGDTSYWVRQGDYARALMFQDEKIATNARAILINICHWNVSG